MSHHIAPSILAADFSNLKEACEIINNSEADYYHIDVMDGHFVPNISFGMPVMASIKPLAKKPFDVHLMIDQPERYITDFKAAGADILTVHLEASTHLHRTIQAIKKEGMKAGVAINPHTSVELLRDIIANIDLVCVMSVNPGFGGQTFIEHTYEKVRKLKSIIQKEKSQALIEIDGGVTIANAKQLINAGADVLVAGSFVFNSDHPKDTISKLKRV